MSKPSKPSSSSSPVDHITELTRAKNEFEVQHENAKLKYQIKVLRRSRPDRFQLTGSCHTKE